MTLGMRVNSPSVASLPYVRALPTAAAIGGADDLSFIL